MLYITIVLAIAVETLGLQLLLTTKITVAAALALNTAAAIFPAFGAYLLRKAGKSPYDCALVSLFTLTLPGIGLYGCFMAILLSKTVIRNKGLAHDLEKNDYIPPLVPNEKIGNRNTFIEQELGVEPIVDILRGTDSGLKRGAIKVLGNLQSREAVTLLRKCLKDPDPEIRFYAHTALTDMEEDFSRKLAAIKISSDEENSKQIHKARILSDYAATGLPGDNMRVEILNSAKELLEAALPKTTEPTPLSLDLAHIYLELGNRHSARKLLMSPVAQNTPRRNTLLNRLFFEERDFPALAALGHFDRPSGENSEPLPAEEPHA